MSTLPATAAAVADGTRPTASSHRRTVNDVRGYGSHAMYLINEAMARARMSEAAQRREPKVRGALGIIASVRRRQAR